MGVRRFGVEYYVGCGYTHASDAIDSPARGPHGSSCNVGTNQPCAFTNVLHLVGHIQTLLLMSNLYSLERALAMVSHDANYSTAQPAGLSSAHRNYGFLFDYNGTCVAHGANADAIGRELAEIAEGS